jgi:ABC-type cobalamin/Fe3+-siderophores transport system ATPase subunit
MLKLRVADVVVSDGTRINLPEAGVVLFVGPNNAGKSQALRDIMGHARPNGPYLAKVLPSVNYAKHGTAEDAGTWVNDHYTKFMRDGMERIVVPGWGEVRPSDFVQQWMNTNVDNLAEALILHADGATRLNAGNAQGNLDFRHQTPVGPIQRAFQDSTLEHEFSKMSEMAFGETVLVDRYAGTIIPLKVGTRPTFEHVDGVPTRDYLQRLADLPLLEDQGDGMRSFMGLMMQLIAGNHQVLLVDEPEAFLHPPQARLLGRLLAEMAVEQQVFIATHSTDVVQGALEAGSNVTIVRLTRHGSINSAAVLDHDALRDLWADPLLRYSDILSGLFHDAVVLCEGDADCRYYSAVRDYMYPVTGADKRRELLFTHCGGKTRMHVVANALSAVRVPVIAIADFDILRENLDIERLANAMTINWEPLQHLRESLNSALTSEVKPLRKTTALDAIAQATERMGEVLSQSEIEDLRRILRAENGWDRAKRAGISSLPQGVTTSAAQQLLDALRHAGIFVVPVGELERFAPTVSGHGPAWVNEVLSQRLHESPSDEAKRFVVAIEAYANRI